MPETYLSREGDTVDLIVHRYYGSTSDGRVEAVLRANPGLCDGGPVLTPGTVVQLPVYTPPAPVTTTRLWE
jgi:phage tail protein X